MTQKEETTLPWNAWMSFQQQMMEQWMSMAMGSTTPWAETWRTSVEQGLDAWTQGTDPIVQDVTRKMFETQMGTMKLVEAYMSAWEQLLPEIEEGGSWQAALDEQVEQMRQQFTKSAAEMARMGRTTSTYWASAMEQWQQMAAPWAQAAQGSFPQMGSMMMGDREAIVDTMNLYWDAYQETFGKLLQAPGIGYSREFDGKMRRSVSAWTDFMEEAYAYQVMLGEIWANAFEQMVRDGVEMYQEDNSVDSVRDLINRWSSIVDGAFLDAFRSEAYIKAQGNLVNAMMEYRTAQRDVNEYFMEWMDIPTRTEVDEAHRRIHELSSELRALRRELAALKEDK